MDSGTKTAIGIILYMGSGLAGSIGNLAMRKASLEKKKMERNGGVPKICLLNPWWVLVAIALALNAALDFASFQFATLSILAPLQGVTIVMNFCVAYFLLDEIVSKNNVVGACIMIAGASLAIVFGPTETSIPLTVLIISDEYLNSISFRLYVSMKILAMLICFIFVNIFQEIPLTAIAPEIDISERETEEGQRNVPPILAQYSASIPEPKAPSASPDPKPNWLTSSTQWTKVQVQKLRANHGKKSSIRQLRIICWGGIVVGWGSWTNALGKISTKLIATSADTSENQFVYFISYFYCVLCICLAAIQFRAMALCMARFPAVQIMPTINCLFIILLIFEGGFVFQEFSLFKSNIDILMFAIGIAICVIGIIVASKVPKIQKMRASREKKSLKSPAVAVHESVVEPASSDSATPLVIHMTSAPRIPDDTVLAPSVDRRTSLPAITGPGGRALAPRS